VLLCAVWSVAGTTLPLVPQPRVPGAVPSLLVVASPVPAAGDARGRVHGAGTDVDADDSAREVWLQVVLAATLLRTTHTPLVRASAVRAVAGRLGWLGAGVLRGAMMAVGVHVVQDGGGGGGGATGGAHCGCTAAVEAAIAQLIATPGVGTVSVDAEAVQPCEACCGRATTRGVAVVTPAEVVFRAVGCAAAARRTSAHKAVAVQCGWLGMDVVPVVVACGGSAQPTASPMGLVLSPARLFGVRATDEVALCRLSRLLATSDGGAGSATPTALPRPAAMAAKARGTHALCDTLTQGAKMTAFQTRSVCCAVVDELE